MMLALFIAIVGCVSLAQLFQMGRVLNGLMNTNYKSISMATQMTNALQKQNQAIITYLYLQPEQGLNDFYQYNRMFRASFTVAARNISEPGEKKLISGVETQHSLLEKMFTTLAQIKSQQGQEAARANYDQNITPCITDIQNNIDSIIDLNQKAIYDNKNKASSRATLSLDLLLVLTAMVVAAGVVLSRYFVNRMLHPLELLTNGIERVKAGELGYTLDIRTGDEIGRLANSFNEMTQRLSTYEKSTLGSLVNERNKSLAIVKSLVDPLAVLNDNHQIMLINPAFEKFFHVRERAALGKHFLEVVENPEIFELIRQSAENSGEHAEKIFSFKNGESIYYNIVANRVTDPQHRTTGFILLMQNVTQLKALEEVKTEFMETVSHELKTPLTSIVMGASLLRENGTGQLNSEQADIVDTIMEDGNRLSGFVNELLEISRMEAGKSIYRFKTCSVKAITENSCRPFRGLAQVRQVTLQNRVPDDLPPVYADFEKITWVLNNLLSNALKYTEAGDTITVDAEPHEGFVEVSVSDTGEGIPPEYLDRIFDKFVQVEGRDIEVRGTGLGLALAKGIITAHKGVISVQSTLNEGSTFRFTLPVFRPEKTQQ